MAFSLIISNSKEIFQFSPLLLDQPKSPFPASYFPWSAKKASHLNLKHKYRISRASSKDIPTEMTEESKFVPLISEEPSYGPPALLLLGFQVEEAAKIQLLLKELDGEFLKLIFCTEDMINRSVWEAVNTKQTNLEASKVAKSLPRICFLSGLTGEEMMMFIDAFPESGLEPTVFAAVVPNSADKPLAELVEEIMGDHEMLNLQMKRARRNAGYNIPVSISASSLIKSPVGRRKLHVA
ncbi:hypothetical protein CASFOL_006041 [Castilleja foliolosa]|uniref:Uncharacterized protein n=1 Tax=Castilleja foliolosa TaxID=1961234 RepID=A0ABD3E5K1_9LAMI